jgi:hypothetical protein
MTSEQTTSTSLDRSKYYSYIANGIPIHSEIEFPELKSGPKHSNVTVCIGKVPSEIDDPIYEGPSSQAGENQYLLNIKNVASYFLQKKGDQFVITVAPLKGVAMSEVRIFILSSMFGALCHMQGFLPLHSSGVVINGKAVLFCGKSGLGKSTLCASLYQKGHAFVTDNLAAIYMGEDGIPMVHPSYSHFRLWKDSMNALEEFSGYVVKMRDEIEKYNMILNDQLQVGAVPIHKIYHLNHHFENEIQIEQLSGRKKTDIIVTETFRIKLLKGLGSQESYFKLLNQICAKTAIAKIYRPTNSFLLEELTQAVLNDSKSTNH